MCFKYVVTIFVLLFLVYPSSAWLSGFDYRINVQINNTDVNATYHIYNFTVDTAALIAAGKMQANGSDCWVTDENDNLLFIWAKDDAFNTPNTKIEINATALGNITNTTHYMYYGKSSAVTQINGSAVFPFFSNFNDCLMPNSSISISILNTTSMGGSSCAGAGDFFKFNDDEYWLIWQHDPVVCEHAGPNLSRNIYHPSNQTQDGIDTDYILSDDLVYKTVSWIGDPYFEKMGDTYYAFFTTRWTDGSLNHTYKNSSTGESQSFGNHTYFSRGGGGASLKVNDTAYWIFSAEKNATIAEMFYWIFNTTTGTFSDINIAKSVPVTDTHHFANVYPYIDPDSGRIFFYYSDITTEYVEKVIYTDDNGATWCDPIQILPNSGAAVPVIKMDGIYYHFYRDDTDNGYMKIATSTDGSNLTYKQTLHSITYSCPQSLEKLNDTHIILHWQKGSCPAGQTAEIDIIEFKTLYSGTFDGNEQYTQFDTSGTSTVEDGILHLYLSHVDTWAGNRWYSNSTFTRPYIFEWTEKTIWGASNDLDTNLLLNDSIGTYAYVMRRGNDYDAAYDWVIHKYCASNVNLATYSWVNDEGYHDYCTILNNTDIIVSMDNTKILHGTDTDFMVGRIAPAVRFYSGTGHRYYDDIRIRDYMDIPPTVSLGSEESAPSVSNETIIVVIL